MNGYIFVSICAVFISAIAQMFLKASAKQAHKSWIFEYLNAWVIGGYSILMGAMVLNVFAMSRGVELKTLMAIESLGYLFISALSYFVFGEKIGKHKMLAIGLIMIGIIIFFI